MWGKETRKLIKEETTKGIRETLLCAFIVKLSKVNSDSMCFIYTIHNGQGTKISASICSRN